MITIQVIEDVAVVVEPPVVTHSCIPLPPGIQVSPQGLEGGGVLSPRVCRVRLDGRHSQVPPISDTKSYVIGKSETHRLLLVVEVGQGRYEWHVALPLVVNGRRAVYQLRSAPFHTAGESNDPL